MFLTRDFTYTAKKPVLLVCDYYETTHIPKEMLEVRDNIALFPIGNVPIVDLILRNLHDQGFNNVILAGTRIDAVVEHVMKIDFNKKMNIRVFKSTGNSLGDIFREFYARGYEFDDMLVMFGNGFTNVSFDMFYRKHKDSKGIVTLFAHKKKTNDNHANVYATVKENNLVFFERMLVEKAVFKNIMECLYENDTIKIDTGLSLPMLAFIGNEVFRIYAENFDYHTFMDMVTGVLAMKLAKGLFKLFTCADFYSNNDDENEYNENLLSDSYDYDDINSDENNNGNDLNNNSIINNKNNLSNNINTVNYYSNYVDNGKYIYYNMEDNKDFSGNMDNGCNLQPINTYVIDTEDNWWWRSNNCQCSCKENSLKYSKASDNNKTSNIPNTGKCNCNIQIYADEIVTLLDYYNMNKDLAQNPGVVDADIYIKIVNNNKYNVAVVDSFVANSSIILANIRNCIVWDDCRVVSEADGNIFVSNNLIFDINYLGKPGAEELMDSPYSEDCKKKETFFDDLRDYLNGLINTAKFHNFGYPEIHKQISLLRIIRHASNEEVVEAFAYFLADIIDTNYLENSLTTASKTFDILVYYVNNVSDQNILLDVILDCLSDYDHDLKIQIFFNYGYLFVQNNIIDKAVLKKYTKLYKAGKL